MTTILQVREMLAELEQMQWPDHGIFQVKLTIFEDGSGYFEVEALAADDRPVGRLMSFIQPSVYRFQFGTGAMGEGSRTIEEAYRAALAYRPTHPEVTR